MASKIFKEDFTPKDNQKWPVKQWLSNCFKQNNTTNTPPSATPSEKAAKAKRLVNLKKGEVNTTLYQKQYNHNRSMASKIFKKDFTSKDNQEWSVKQWLFNCFKKNSTTSNTTNTSSPSATLSE